MSQNTENISPATNVSDGVIEQKFSIIQNNNQNNDITNNSMTESAQPTENNTTGTQTPAPTVSVKTSKRGAPRKHFTKSRKFYTFDDGSIRPCGRGRPSRAWKPEEIKSIDVPFDWQPGQEVPGYKLFVEPPIE